MNASSGDFPTGLSRAQVSTYDGHVAEGDSLKRAEIRLQPVLLGRKVESIWFKKIRGSKPRAGQTITRVEAQGKNLLIEFDGKLVLRTHLGMHGSWKSFPGKTIDVDDVRYRPGNSASLTTSSGTAICAKAQVIETFAASQPPAAIAKLGPDLISTDPDFNSVVENAQAKPKLMLCEALLDQQIACGIGNIYKSEALFHARLNPFQTVEACDEHQLREVFETASRMLRDNSRSGDQRRRTSLVGQYYVYERYRLPCRRCTTPIRRDYRGEFERSTYSCPRCQDSGVPS